MSASALWWLTLAAGVLVVLLVAVLLAAILSTAQRIKMTLGEIWTVGKMVACDTAHVDMLRQLNLAAGEMLASLRLTNEQTQGHKAKGPP